MNSRSLFLQTAVANGRFEYQAGDVTPIQRGHTTGWRSMPVMVLAQLSKGQADLALEDGRTLHVTSGQCFCVPPGVRHCCTTTARRGISRWSHSNFYLLGSLNITNWLSLPLILTGSTAREIGDLNGELADLCRHPPSLKNAMAFQATGWALWRILAEVAQPKGGLALRLGSAERLAPVLAYLDQNLHVYKSQAELAKMAHLSISRFRAVFKEALGVNVQAYVNQLRIQRAQLLLVQTDCFVQEIAARSGHGDPFHFSRLFKRKCGVSPSEYRRLARQSHF